MKIICDTNIFIEIFKKNFFIRSELIRIGYENIFISDVVKAELFFGANNKIELVNIKKSIEDFPVLPILPEISKMAVNFVENYCLSNKLNLPDALIAATSIYYNIELFTLNIKDFKYIPNLKLYQK